MNYNYIEVDAGPGGSSGTIPSKKVSAGTYIKVNNMGLALLPVIAGALVVGAYLTQGEILRWIGQGFPILVR
jgi:hypothetical protein